MMAKRKTMIKRFFSLSLVLIMTLVLVTACGSNTQTPSKSTGTAAAGQPQYGGTLKLVNTAEGAAPLGVPWENTTNDTTLQPPCLETLVRESTKGEYVPLLAKDWTVDNANKQIVFNLQQGVKFHDGTDFNADAAVFCLQKAIDAKVLSLFTGAKKLGDYQIALTFTNYSNTAMSTLAGRYASFISPTAFNKNGIEWARKNPVGTGPFTFDTFTRGQILKYVKNKDYWQKGKPYLDAVQYMFIKDPMTQQAALQATGDQSIDCLNTTSGEIIAQLKSNSNLKVASLSIGPISLVPSSKDPANPLSKLEVRQAIYSAIDRDSIVAARGFGVWTPAYQYAGKAWDANIESLNANPYNVTKAKDLLTKAGYPNGFSTTIYGMPNFADKDALTAVQNQLSKVGITVKLEFPDSGGYTTFRKGTWSGLLCHHVRAFSNINYGYNIYVNPDYKDFPEMLRTPKILDLYKQSLATEKVDKAKSQAVNQEIYDSMMIIPLYYIFDSFVMKSNVQDTGFSEWGSSTIWIPENAWLSKK